MTAPKRLLHAVVGWVVLTLAAVLPQWALATSRPAAAALGVLLAGAWAFVVFRAAVRPAMGLLGAGAGVLVVGLMHLIGTGDFQAARKLYEGHALEDVTLAEAIDRREDGVWVKLTDARVRSEATYEVTLVSGGGEDEDGNPRQQTEHRLAFAPLTLASEVREELAPLRRKPTGRVLLWACAPSSGLLSDFDRERQAVRGRLTRIEPDFFAALSGRLLPAAPEVIPGAGAIPAAGGAPGNPGVAGGGPRAPDEAERLQLGIEAWCVNLDRALTADEAKEQAVGSALAFLFSIPFFTALFAGFFAFLKKDE